jgi:pyridoxine 5-phosphate synthase
MLEIALRHRPNAACIVPEKREERTTEGGLDAAGQHNHLAYYVDKLGSAGIRVSLFIEPRAQIEAASGCGRRSSSSIPGATPMSQARSAWPN